MAQSLLGVLSMEPSWEENRLKWAKTGQVHPVKQVELTKRRPQLGQIEPNAPRNTKIKGKKPRNRRKTFKRNEKQRKTRT